MKRIIILLLLICQFEQYVLGQDYVMTVGDTQTLTAPVSGTLSGNVEWYYDDFIFSITSRTANYRSYTFKAMNPTSYPSTTTINAYWDTYYYDSKGRIILESHSQSWIIKVNPVNPTSISLNTNEITLIEGETRTLKATVYPAQASQTVVWESENPSVASVSSSGVITAGSVGKTTIKARAKDDTSIVNSCYVTVEKAELQSIDLPRSLAIELGDIKKLDITFNPASAACAVTWGSYDESVVKIDNNGYVTAVGLGTTQVYAVTNDGTHKATTTVDVKLPKLSISATPSGEMMPYMQELTLTASNANAKIYYTIDGTEPTKESILYDSPLRIENSLTVKAKAYLDGYEESEMLEKTCKLKLDIKASAQSGTVFLGDKVYLTCSHPNAKIFYTTDGTYPTDKSLLYNGEISLEKDMVLNAVAVCNSCENSDILTLHFVMSQATIMANITDTFVERGTMISLSATPSITAIPNITTIYYTLDGSDPLSSASRQVYRHAIPVLNVLELKAVAICSKYYKESEVLHQTYYAYQNFEYVDDTISTNIYYKPTLTYNTKIQLGANTITLKDDAGQSVAGTVSVDGCSLTFIPQYELKSGVTYTLTIPEGALKDMHMAPIQHRQFVFHTYLPPIPVVDFKYKDIEHYTSTEHYRYALLENHTLWQWDTNSLPRKIQDDVTSFVVASTDEIRLYSKHTDESLWLNDKKLFENVDTFFVYNNDDCFIIQKDGSIWEQIINNDINWSPKKIATFNNIKAFYYNSISMSYGVIDGDDNLYMWGLNTKGQVGAGMIGNGKSGSNYRTSLESPIKILDNVKSLIMVGYSVYAVKNDGTLWAWGENVNGVLGINASVSQQLKPALVLSDVEFIVPNIDPQIYSSDVQGGSLSNLGRGRNADVVYAKKTDASLWGWGKGEVFRDIQDSPVKLLDDIDTLYHMYEYAVVVKKNDKSLWAMGSNLFGVIGDGTYDSCHYFKHVIDDVEGFYYNRYQRVAIKVDGSAWGWGRNFHGELGTGASDYTPIPTKIMEDVTNVYLTTDQSQNTFFIKNDNTLWGVGYNEGQRLGLGDDAEVEWSKDLYGVEYIYTPAKIMDNVKSIYCTSQYFALDNWGGLYGWGTERNSAYFGTDLDEQFIGKPAVIFNSPQPLTDIKLTDCSIQIKPGDKRVLIPELTPVYATLPTSLEWSSSNSSIVSVSQSGEIVAKEVGKANIIVQDGRELTASCEVVVTEFPQMLLGKDTDDSESFSSCYDLDFSEIPDLKAYIIDYYDEEDDCMYYKQVYTVPAGTGVILKGPNGTYQIPIKSTNKEYNNYLVGTNAKIKVHPTNENSTLYNWAYQNQSFRKLSSDVITDAWNIYLQSSANMNLYDIRMPKDIVSDTDISELDNILYVENKNIFADGLNAVYLKMKNSAEVSAIEFDIELPEGTNFSSIALTMDRISSRADFTPSVTALSDRKYHISYYPNSSNVTFSDNDGNIARITIETDEELALGDYSLILTNIELSDPDMRTYSYPLIKSTLTVIDGILGDVNDSKTVSVADIVGIVNYKSGRIMDNFHEERADVNGDGNISIADIVGIVNTIVRNARRQNMPKTERQQLNPQ